MSFTFDGIVLPSPDWGNTQALSVKQHTHRSISGEYFTYVNKPIHDTQFPDEMYRFMYTFSNVTYKKYLELRAVLDAVIGRVTVTDHEDNVWSVDLLSPTTSIVFDTRRISAVDYANQECSDYTNVYYAELGTITMELEGFKVYV